jgi:hypothetical protein
MDGQDFFANGAPAGCFRGANFFKQPDPLGKRMSPSCPDVQALNIFEPRSYRMNTNKTENKILRRSRSPFVKICAIVG